eukprot:12547284-Prorocentrum_lima.AAC.1
MQCACFIGKVCAIAIEGCGPLKRTGGSWEVYLGGASGSLLRSRPCPLVLRLERLRWDAMNC